jgi:SAM-dependent methyltransferase
VSEASHYRPPTIAVRLREHSRRQGAGRVAWKCIRWTAGYIAGLPRAAVGRGRRFRFEGHEYRTVHAFHNWTWLNERAVELPIARRAVEQYRGRRVLEVGNVLSHYFASDHVVIDKYERGPGVINVDALDLDSSQTWDLIVSVSTIEHIGWDEHPRQPDGAERAILHLTGLLAPGGKLLATVPTGYNPQLDGAIRDGRLGLSSLTALRRPDKRNRWAEVSPQVALAAPYDSLLYTARGVLVLEVERR